LPLAPAYRFPFVFTSQSSTKASMVPSRRGSRRLGSMFLGTDSRRTLSVKMGTPASTGKMWPCSQTSVSSRTRRLLRSKGHARTVVSCSPSKSMLSPRLIVYFISRDLAIRLRSVSEIGYAARGGARQTAKRSACDFPQGLFRPQIRCAERGRSVRCARHKPKLEFPANGRGYLVEARQPGKGLWQIRHHDLFRP
jgi:hypothetical protein